MRFKANRIWLCPFQLSVLSLAMASVVNSAQAQSGLIQEITVTAQKRVSDSKVLVHDWFCLCYSASGNMC